jgi:hypothetical protein
MRSFLAPALLFCGAAAAATYEVGPGKPLAGIREVPWHELQAGDTVLIYWSPEPYREKWVICRQGTADAPITVRGVANDEGVLPVIAAADATTPAPLNYWNEERSLLKIGGANTPSDLTPRWITVENLDLRGATPGRAFTGDDGSARIYSANAAAVFIEKGEHITIRHCTLSDSGNGLFVSSAARDVLIDANWIHSNGNVGSQYEHNSYTEALGIVFQFNHYGPLREGALGNNLKDRSAGLVVRYNWIESGNRQLDLVDAGDAALYGDPAYRESFVYGNILVEPAGAGNRQIVHYGGDSGTTSRYRKGTLWFYHNTVISTRTDRTTLFRLSTNDEGCYAWNNVIYTTLPGDTLALLDQSGGLWFERNALKAGWVAGFFGVDMQISGLTALLETDSPDFVDFVAQDYRPAALSPLVGAQIGLPEDVQARHPILWSYVRRQAGQPRDPAQALGALDPP